MLYTMELLHHFFVVRFSSLQASLRHALLNPRKSDFDRKINAKHFAGRMKNPICGLGIEREPCTTIGRFPTILGEGAPRQQSEIFETKILKCYYTPLITTVSTCRVKTFFFVLKAPDFRSFFLAINTETHATTGLVR